MTIVSTATAAPRTSPHVSVNRPNPVSVGTIVWLASELMFFAGLFAMYFTLRGADPEAWAENTPKLNITFAAINTTVLVLSSVTCQMGVWAAERFQPVRTGSLIQVNRWGMNEWMTLTYLMGAFFIGGQIYEYSTLVSDDGLTLSSNAYGSVFYLTTGFHGLHVTGGLIAFLFVLGRTFVARKFTHEQAVSAIVVSYYWHFVDVVWIGLFATIYLVQ